MNSSKRLVHALLHTHDPNCLIFGTELPSIYSKQYDFMTLFPILLLCSSPIRYELKSNLRKFKQCCKSCVTGRLWRISWPWKPLTRYFGKELDKRGQELILCYLGKPLWGFLSRIPTKQMVTRLRTLCDIWLISFWLGSCCRSKIQTSIIGVYLISCSCKTNILEYVW